MKWVQDNIQYLNGDNNKVTIFGESAGGISVSLLTLSPMAKGLFHRAIIQSGPAIIPFVNHGLNGRTLAKKLGQAVDCPTSNMEYLVECLRRIDPTVIAPYGNFLNEMVQYIFIYDHLCQIYSFEYLLGMGRKQNFHGTIYRNIRSG